MGLEKMMDELLCRPDLNIHMAGVQKVVTDKRRNGGATMKAIIVVVGEMNGLTATGALPKTNNEYRTNRTKGGKGNGRRRGKLNKWC